MHDSKHTPSRRFPKWSVLLPLLTSFHAAIAESRRTPLERAHYSRISTSGEFSQYLDHLAARFPTLAHKEVLGDSVAERPLEVLRLYAPDLHEPHFKVMIIGSQHGAAEPAGGEALLVIARELSSGPLRSLLDDMEILILANANPDGRDLKRRSNAKRININTDFVLLSQPESRQLLAAVTRYRPDALLDSHESAVLKQQTLARAGYLTDFNAQFEVSNNPAVPAMLRDYALRELLPPLLQRVTAGGLPAQRYIGEITSLKQAITNGGLTLRNFRNAAGIAGGLSFLVETKRDPKTGTYPTYRNIAVRVDRQLLCLRSFITVMHQQRAAIRAKVMAARAAMTLEPLILFAGYASDAAHAEVEIPLHRIATGHLETLKFRDHRQVVTADEIPYPPMLVITAHVDKLRDVIERHGINVWSLDHPTSAEVVAERYRARPTLNGRAELNPETKKTINIESGALFIDLAQPNGRAAALLLNPRSPSSLFRTPEYADLLLPNQEFFVYRTYKGATRSPP